MMNKTEVPGYRYYDAALNRSHNYLLPNVSKILNEINHSKGKKNIFELGCGNGSVANELSKSGWDVTGVDISEEGIEQARIAYPQLKLGIGTAYDDLASKYGQFPVVLSLEVVEHVYAPRDYMKTIYELLSSKGSVVLSTPYHGYFKNLALAVTGKMDAHYTALWDHGHIKFWSIKTLRQLLIETGFSNIQFRRVGRIPPFAKSMIVIAQKP